MRRTQALETLEDPDLCARLTMDGFYNTLIRAGYSPDEAQQISNERNWSKLSSGNTL